jgi:hypothetical protein
MCRTGANHAATMAQSGRRTAKASIASAAMAGFATFFPWVCARSAPHSSRGPRKSQRAILRFASARRRVRRRSPSACRPPSRSRWSRARTIKET